MKKTLALLLAILIFAATLVSCGRLNTKEDTDQQQTDSVSTNTGDDIRYDENGYQMDDLGEDLNFGGKEISILGWSEVENKYPEFGIEELGSSTVSDSAYLKNMAVQNRLNVRLRFDTVKGWTGPGDGSGEEQLVRVQAAAGTDEIDLIGTYSWNACTFMVNGYISNLKSMPHLDLSKPWWNESIVEKSSIYGSIYYATGDISSAYIGNIYAMFFNKRMVEDNKLEDPYKLYDDGKWTLDKMIEMSKKVTSEDTYGFVSYGTPLDSFYQGCGFMLVDNAPDGSLLLSDDFTSSEVHDLVSTLVDFNNTDACYIEESSGEGHLKIWNDGKALFCLTDIYHSSRFPDGNAENFGILPMPKYDEAQQEYHSLVGFYYSMYCIPKTSEGDAMIGAVLECLASEAYRRVTPAYYDNLIKYRVSATVKEAMMFDTVRDCVVIDSGRIFQKHIGWKIWGEFRNSILKSSKDWMSASAGIAPGFEQKITSLNEMANILG